MSQDETPPPAPALAPEHVLPNDRVHWDALMDAVSARMPNLGLVLEAHGRQPVLNYVQASMEPGHPTSVPKTRTAELISTIGEYVTHAYGAASAAAVATQLGEYYYAATADHFGCLCHSWFVHPHLTEAAVIQRVAKPPLTSSIVLANANVSLNNVSFPRGLVFHARGRNGIAQHRLSFLPSTSHSATIWNFRPFSERDVTKLRGVLYQKVRDGDIPRLVGEKALALLTSVYATPSVLGAKTLSSQMSLANAALWKTSFDAAGGVAPRLIYLEQEQLVGRLLATHHMTSDTPVTRMLCGNAVDSLAHSYFDGIPGSFSSDKDKGTYMFWGISRNNNRRIRLRKTRDSYVSEDGSFRVYADRDALGQALEQNIIAPNVLVIFVVLAFYYGLRCLGGPSQIHYLTAMKNAYATLLTQVGDAEEASFFADVQTQRLHCDFNTAFLDGDAAMLPATLADVFLSAGPDTWDRMTADLSSLSLEHALIAELPQYYARRYRLEERHLALSSHTTASILRELGRREVIKPFCTL